MLSQVGVGTCQHPEIASTATRIPKPLAVAGGRDLPHVEVYYHGGSGDGRPWGFRRQAGEVILWDGLVEAGGTLVDSKSISNNALRNVFKKCSLMLIDGDDRGPGHQ